MAVWVVPVIWFSQMWVFWFSGGAQPWVWAWVYWVVVVARSLLMPGWFGFRVGSMSSSSLRLSCGLRFARSLKACAQRFSFMVLAVVRKAVSVSL